MEIFENIMNVISNNGIGIACTLYLMYFHHTTMRDLQKNMQDMANILGIIKEEIKKK